MEKLTLDDIKQIELELMDEFDRICREQKITYFLAYGSLLGAVRHGGFIPWDDDMDVVMIRSEYELFIEGFDRWKSDSRFELASYRDGKSIYPFIKLADSSTAVYENFVNKNISIGVWIDIFPLDDVGLHDKRVFRRNTWIGLLRSFIVADPTVGSSVVAKLAKRLICPFVRRLDAVSYARKIDENAQRAGEGIVTEVVADVIGEGKPHLLFPKSLFEPVEIEFEGRQYFAPRDFEEYLYIQYGDWRTPPAEDNREAHVFEAYRL